VSAVLTGDGTRPPPGSTSSAAAGGSPSPPTTCLSSPRRTSTSSGSWAPAIARALRTASRPAPSIPIPRGARGWSSTPRSIRGTTPASPSPGSPAMATRPPRARTSCAGVDRV